MLSIVDHGQTCSKDANMEFKVSCLIVSSRSCLDVFSLSERSCLDVFSLSEIGPASSNCLQRWRQQIENSMREWFPVRRMFFLDDIHCLKFAQCISTIFHLGGSKPEVVIGDISCGESMFLINCDCSGVAQSISDVGHTGDQSGSPLPVCMPSRCKTLGFDYHTGKLSKTT